MAKIIINHEGKMCPIENARVESINSGSVSLRLPKEDFTAKQILDYTRMGLLRSTYCYDEGYSATVDITKVEDIID